MEVYRDRQNIKRLSRDRYSNRDSRYWTQLRLMAGSELNSSPEERTARNLGILPTLAKDFYQDSSSKSWGFNSVLKAIFAGTRSDGDGAPPLALLRDHENTLVRKIIEMVGSNPLAEHVRLTIPASLVGNGYGALMKFTHGRGQGEFHKREMLEEMTKRGDQREGRVAFSRCGMVDFPESKDRNVNMMPFILGNKNSLPDDLRDYYNLVEACPFVKEELGKVAFLTVQESYIDVGTSQRRGGLHIESPGFFSDDPNAASLKLGEEHPWGMGIFFGPDHYEGGIYFASNRSDTSELWDALVDSSVPGLVDRGGGCEHLRAWIGQGTKLQGGELVWMTDRTPHEALPQKTSGHRQFFRLVMPYVNHWYADHSTPNPDVPLPDHIKVIHGNKFEHQAGAKLPAVEATAATTSQQQSSKKASSDVVSSTPAHSAVIDEAERIEAALKLEPSSDIVFSTPGVRASVEEAERMEAALQRRRNEKQDRDKALKESRMLIEPKDLFRLAEEHKGKYSKFNEETGIPTHDAGGHELNKFAIKKLAKEQKKHARNLVAHKKNQK